MASGIWNVDVDDNSDNDSDIYRDNAKAQPSKARRKEAS
jgi:hypothetical protein